jgi:hypothetical protein
MILRLQENEYGRSRGKPYGNLETHPGIIFGKD